MNAWCEAPTPARRHVAAAGARLCRVLRGRMTPDGRARYTVAYTPPAHSWPGGRQQINGQLAPQGNVA